MITRPPIKVMVIDDSLVFRKYLIENLPKVQPRIEIIGYATDPYDAMQKLRTLKPDVITLDIEMPRMTGLEFLKELLPKNPLPVILVSSLNVSVFDALSYGAVDFVRKPDMSKNNAKEAFVKSLSSKVVIASQARVRVPASLGKGVSGSAAPGAKRTASSSLSARPASASAKPVVSAEKLASTLSKGVIRLTTSNQLKLNSTVIAIGASTGGTEATLEVMQQLPADIPAMVITQHMPKGFTKMYAERLNRLCRMEVREARDGDVLKRGLALLAPGGDFQMEVVKKGRDYVTECKPGAKVSGHRPSVDVLFRSVAEAVRSNAVGIILTGMGQDGAEGLLQMRQNGAYTLGQDKESCVVYGMPMVAYSMGAVCMQASCSAIPTALMKHLNSF